MTREGAKKIKDALYLALSVVSEQCRGTDLCENCPLNNLRPGTDGDYTTLPDNATKAWLTPTQWKDKELGVCVRAETATEGVWVRDKYLKLFSKGDYDLYIAPEAKQLWLTEPNTREVIGVIAGVRGIKV